jgi:uracil-DNA glycosylase
MSLTKTRVFECGAPAVRDDGSSDRVAVHGTSELRLQGAERVSTIPTLEELISLAQQEALRGEMSIDLETYARLGREPSTPLIGGGSTEAPIGFFGRDPGRDEVKHMEPLIGAAGQLVRAGVHRALYGVEPPDFAASQALASEVFFSNTVPYKPLGNKAWSMAVKRRFRAVIASYLVDHWRGRDLITLGNVAFHWFGIEESREERARLRDFFETEGRYERSLEVEVWSPLSDARKTLSLHPLPHPSPLNATWYKRFPALLDQRLASLGLTV